MTIEVTPDDFIRFFNQFGGSYNCEICSNDRFELLHNPSEETAGLVAHKSGRPLQAIELISIGCTKCGNVKSFWGQHVARWVEANPE